MTRPNCPKCGREGAALVSALYGGLRLDDVSFEWRCAGCGNQWKEEKTLQR